MKLNIKGRFCGTYMKRSLTIDVSAINIDFIVVQERNDIVHVCMRNGMEHDVASNLFDLANHNFK